MQMSNHSCTLSPQNMAKHTNWRVAVTKYAKHGLKVYLGCHCLCDESLPPILSQQAQHRCSAEDRAHRRALVEEARPPQPVGLSGVEQQRLLELLVLLGPLLKGCPGSPVLPPHLNVTYADFIKLLV